MKKVLLAGAFLLGLMSAASATCTSPAVMHDFPGTSFNMSLATAPDGNCASNLSLPNSTATGAITTTQSVTLAPTGGQSTVGIQVSGTWTGTLFIEGSVDGTNFSQTTVVPLTVANSPPAATITANGIWQANAAGLASLRVRGNTVASGSATVTLIGSSGTANVMADNPIQVTGWTGMVALNVVGNTTIGSATTDKPLMLGGSSTGASGGNAQIAKVDTSGNLYSLPGTAANWGIGATGATVPANAVYLGINSGGNLTGWNGAITAASSAFASGSLASGAGTDGWDSTQGAKADAACAGGGSACSVEARLAHLENLAAGAVPAGANVIGYISNDPCAQATKLGASISLTASGQVITGTAAKKTYICSIDIVSATAQNIALVEGTGSTCATNIFGLAGGTTAATGWNLAANGGLTKGGGFGSVYFGSADANATAANICLLSSSTGQISGEITYVQQ